MRLLGLFTVAAITASPVLACDDFKQLDTLYELNLEQVQQCLADGGDPNAIIQGRGVAAIHVAAGAIGNAAILSAMIEAGGNPNLVDEMGNTPIHWAASKINNPEIITSLISYGADPNIPRDDDTHMTALNMALFNKNPEILRALLEGGADPLQNSEYERLPIHWAASMDASAEKIEMLAEATGNIDIRDGMMDSTPLHFAAQAASKTETIDILLALGADLQAEDYRSNSPLHRAVESNDNFYMLEYLIEVGADGNAPGYGDLTPLHHAAKYSDDVRVIDLLVAAGADIDAQAEWGDTPLFRAAEYNDNPEIVRHFLEIGSDPNITDEHGRKPVMIAARENENIEILKMLLEATDDPFAPNDYGATLLVEASAANENAEIIKFLSEQQPDNQDSSVALNRALYGNGREVEVIAQLIEQGADVNAKDKNGDTPLIKALQFEAEPGLIDLLMDAGADVSAHGEFGYTALHEAASHSKNYIYIDQLIAAGANIEATRDNGATPLHDAAYYGVAEAALKLLDFDANPNALQEDERTPLVYAFYSSFNQDDVIEVLIPVTDLDSVDITDRTPLHTAVRKIASPSIVLQMLEAGADPNATDSNENTAFGWALTHSSYVDILPKFLEYGADIHLPPLPGHTALGLAALSGNESFVRQLLDAGAEVDQINVDGATALFSTRGNASIAQVLLDAGADVNHTDFVGDTPLHFAAGGYSELIKLLLDRGANFQARNDEGLTPFLWGWISTSIAQTLLDAGADVDQKGDGGNTPLHHAAGEQNVELVQFLLDQGANLQAKNDDGQTPLAYAMSGYYDYLPEPYVINMLIDAGADPKDIPIEVARAYGLAFDETAFSFKYSILDESSGFNGSYVEAVAYDNGEVLVANMDYSGDFIQSYAYLIDVETGQIKTVFENPVSESSLFFGDDLELSGPYAFIFGRVSPSRDEGSAQSETATIYVYDRESGDLVEAITNPLETNSEHFGYEIDASNDFLAISARAKINRDGSFADDTGYVHIYDIDTLELVRSISPSYDKELDFGRSIAINNTRVLIGSVELYGRSENEGKGYLFDAASGELIRYFENPYPDFIDRFGATVVLDDKYVLISGFAKKENGTRIESRTADTIFVFDILTGELLHELRNPMQDLFEYGFGGRLSVSNGIVVTGVQQDIVEPDLPNYLFAFDLSTGELIENIPHPQGIVSHGYGRDIVFGDDWLIVANKFNTNEEQLLASVFKYEPPEQAKVKEELFSLHGAL